MKVIKFHLIPFFGHSILNNMRTSPFWSNFLSCWFLKMISLIIHKIYMFFCVETYIFCVGHFVRWIVFMLSRNDEHFNRNKTEVSLNQFKTTKSSWIVIESCRRVSHSYGLRIHLHPKFTTQMVNEHQIKMVLKMILWSNRSLYQFLHFLWHCFHRPK